MRIGWLADEHDPPGGAELTQAEFRDAAPAGVEVIGCPPDKIADCGLYVLHNTQTYDDLPSPSIRYHHDARGGEADRHIYCSPRLGEPYIPPPVDLARFRPPRQVRRNGKRDGTVCVGSFLNPGKGGQLVAEWAAHNESVDVYGFGPFLPRGQHIELKGPIAQGALPQLLWRYERFVFLPTALEPFGRCVIEAHVAGCELIVNKNVGALDFLDRTEEIESAAERFWGLVCS